MSDTPRYHINPKTGNPGICRAQYSCRFGSIDRDHFETKDQARAYFEQKMNDIQADEKEVIKSLESRLIREEECDFDYIEFAVTSIKEWPKPWTENEKENLMNVSRMSEILSKDKMTSEDWDKVESIQKLLHEVESSPYYVPKQDNDYKRRDKNILSLARNLITRRKADDYETPEYEPRMKNNRIMGLESARIQAINDYNMIGTDSSYGNRKPLIQTDPSGDLEQTLDRIVSGEVYRHDPRYSTDAHVSLIPKKDRLMSILSDDESDTYRNQLYMATVFPDRELKEAMDRDGVDNVTATSFDNGRESGLAYTVMDMDGNSRTFSVYEHRNSDSIIINGKSNWNGTELPYATDSKNGFFAEFGPDDHKAVADSLSFYMKEAQSGELHNDADLVATVQRRDWNAILSDSLPGFKQWSEDMKKKEIETRKKKEIAEKREESIRRLKNSSNATDRAFSDIMMNSNLSDE